MDISKAITEPFANYHNFHENLNIRVKIIAASLTHTLSYLNAPGNDDEIGSLIKAADPSWKFPPVLNSSNQDITIEKVFLPFINHCRPWM